jgi:hypothetical protein
MATKRRTPARRRRYNFTRKSAGPRKMTIPLAVVAGFAPPATYLWSQRSGGIGNVGNEMGKIFTGWDGYSHTWNANYLKWGLLPIGIGVVVHKVSNMLGVNRQLAAMGIPLIRI